MTINIFKPIEGLPPKRRPVGAADFGSVKYPVQKNRAANEANFGFGSEQSMRQLDLGDDVLCATDEVLEVQTPLRTGFEDDEYNFELLRCCGAV